MRVPRVKQKMRAKTQGVRNFMRTVEGYNRKVQNFVRKHSRS